MAMLKKRRKEKQILKSSNVCLVKDIFTGFPGAFKRVFHNISSSVWDYNSHNSEQA